MVADPRQRGAIVERIKFSKKKKCKENFKGRKRKGGRGGRNGNLSKGRLKVAQKSTEYAKRSRKAHPFAIGEVGKKIVIKNPLSTAEVWGGVKAYRIRNGVTISLWESKSRVNVSD